MYDLIKKVQKNDSITNTRSGNESDYSTIKTVRESRSNNSRSSKTKIIRKEKLNQTLQKLRVELEKKIARATEDFNAIILEDSESSESQGKNSVDDWEPKVNNGVISSNEKLDPNAQLARPKHPLVTKRPNELTDEELP